MPERHGVRSMFPHAGLPRAHRTRVQAWVAGVVAVLALAAPIGPASGSTVFRPDGRALPNANRVVTGQGYQLVGADGGVFSLGWLRNEGSVAGRLSGSEVAGIALTRTGRGYWLASRDGGIFAFGDANYHGSLHDTDTTNADTVAIAATPTGNGYWLASRDGGIFAFGDANYHGSLGGRHLNAPIVAVAGGRGYHRPATLADLEPSLPPVAPPPPAPAPPPPPPPARQLPPASSMPAAADAEAGGRAGYDISYPQCEQAYPTHPFAFGIVGVTRGRAFRHNPCLASQWQWATSSGAAGVYVNVNFPGPAHELDLGATGPQPQCNGDLPCIAYNFGFNGASDALDYAHSQGVAVPFVWLDIEIANYWTPDRALNAVVVRGAIDAVRQAGKEVGIYSTPYMWRRIAGDFAPGLPMWIAGAPDLAAAPGWCQRSFAGGPVVFVQTLPVVYDENYTCPGHGPMRRFFAG